MYPLFYYWYKGKNVEFYMNFKSSAFNLSESEFSKAYTELECRANDRETDLNVQSVNFMLEKLDKNSMTLLMRAAGAVTG
jgi:hypothetical protein